MVSYVFDPNAIATGEIPSGPSFTPDYLPIEDFLSWLESNGTDTSNAQVILSLPGTAEDYADGIPADTKITLGIDVDGDGVVDYDIAPSPRNNTEEGNNLRLDNLVGGNLGFFEGSFGIYPAGSTDSLFTGTGRFYLTTDPGGFTVGDPLPITGGGSGVLDVDDVEVLPCFVRGTLIDTPEGARRIEDLAEGDMVLTLDHGPQPIRWIGSRKVGASALRRHPKLQPIRIAAGALGKGIPETDLVVSPQHRLMLSSRVVRNMFDADEVLVPAKKLLGFPGVTQDTVRSVEYFHILLDRHEVVRANGAWTETLLTGPMALKAIGPEAVREIALLFPEIASPSHVAPPARRIAEGRRIPQLMARHLKNRRDLCEPMRRPA